ncbi:MAG TPA: response regulator transcription factor [Thermoleophilaceae bacterium]|nr:response regulator transcription factor [Thermoleophilaceae bacterium]
MAATREANLLHVGDLEIRPGEGLVVAAGRVVPMSARELGVLVALAGRAGRVVSRRELYETVWGGPLRDGDRSIDVYVHKVRAKLEAALPERRFIHTHVGFGYRLSPELSHTFHNPATAT